MKSATPNQIGFLLQLLLSSEFSADEYTATLAWIESENCTVETCKRAIDKALARIRARDDRQTDAKARQDKARQDKTEYSKEINGKAFDNPIDAAAEASRVLFG